MKKIFFLAIAQCLSLSALLYFLKKPIHPVSGTVAHYVDEQRIFDAKPRSLEVVFWYPTNKSVKTTPQEYGIWKLGDVAVDTPIIPDKLPLILFSHGFGGDPYGNSWFAHYLASHGYIVACVKHYGNAFGNMIPELGARPWNRPLDMSFILDKILSDPRFKDHIDANRIGAAGFSQGGMTTLWLAGVKANLDQELLYKYMASIKDNEWRSVFENFTQSDISDANKSYHDDRIKAVFAMAPGLDFNNWMFTKESLLTVYTPIYLVVGDADMVVSADEHAKFFAQNIPSSTLTILSPNVSHWVFMNESTQEGKKINPKITIDAPGADRTKIHKSVGRTALKFFDTNLKTSSKTPK
ncbi:prolyl oligopeptidase family serine peptidase [Candidatus Babeliales bacterium]|nr:prolyl oligopeptidase family serine peptidase [Candidatus Babeliales bacterium]